MCDPNGLRSGGENVLMEEKCWHMFILLHNYTENSNLSDTKCIYACVCVCMYVFMYVCVCVCCLLLLHPFSQQTATTALTHSHNKQPPSPWSTWSSLLHDKNWNFKSHLYSLWTPVAHCGKHNYISLWKRKQWAQLNLHVWWSVQSALFMLQPKSVLIVGRGISSARRILWTWVASTWEVFQIASQLRLYNCNIHT